MNASENRDFDPLRRKLLETKLGNLLTWSMPEIRETIGPFDPTPFEHYDERRRDIITKCRDELVRRSDEEIAILTNWGLPDPAGARKSWSSFQDGSVKRLTSRRLPWHAGGFGHTGYRANFEHWCKMPHFSVDELLCLSIGIEPEHFPSAKINQLQKETPSSLWPTETFLLRRLELLKRQFDPYSYGDKVRPQELLNWVGKVDLDTSPEFLTLLRKFHGDNPEVPLTGAQPSDTKPKKQDKREVDSIAQLFTAMAMEYFGYNPNDAKSSVTKEITDLAASMGMSLSDDTVRKYLQMGGSYVPKDWMPNNR